MRFWRSAGPPRVGGQAQVARASALADAQLERSRQLAAADDGLAAARSAAATQSVFLVTGHAEQRAQAESLAESAWAEADARAALLLTEAATAAAAGQQRALGEAEVARTRGTAVAAAA